MACTWRRILRACPASRRRSGERQAAAPVEDSRGRRPGGQRAAPAERSRERRLHRCRHVTDPGLVVARCTEEPPDLLLLDWHMPGRSGAGILEDIAFLTDEPNWMPVLVLTVDIAPDTKRQALSLGARDFLTKPIDVTEVLRARAQPAADPLSPGRARSATTISCTSASRSARASSRTPSSRCSTVSRSPPSTATTRPASMPSGSAARASCSRSRWGSTPAEATLIGQAARLHDIGKIGIADELLLKPGKYTAEEFAAMKLHPAIGARILSGSTNELLMMAEQIALTHHERWDGHGYPSGLAGEAIPLPGRIVTVADVFDALTHRRPYKEPWPVHVAVREIFGEAGTQVRPPRHRGVRSARPREPSCSRRRRAAARGRGQDDSGRPTGRAAADQPIRALAAPSVSRSATRAGRRPRPGCECRTSAWPSRAARACAPSAGRSRACGRPARRACPRRAAAGRRARAWSA